MRLAIIATIIFLAGLWPGLAKFTGAPPDPPRPGHNAVAATPAHPVLTRMAAVLKLRL